MLNIHLSFNVVESWLPNFLTLYSYFQTEGILRTVSRKTPQVTSSDNNKTVYVIE